MYDTVLDLWNGNIAPCEHCGAHDPELNRIVDSIQRNREALFAELTEQQREMFQKYLDCAEEYLLRMLELAFAEGFCLGAKIIMETLL